VVHFAFTIHFFLVASLSSFFPHSYLVVKKKMAERRIQSQDKYGDRVRKKKLHQGSA
jgi:hypothetical protein